MTAPEQDPIQVAIVESWHRQRTAVAERKAATLEQVADAITTRTDDTEAETAEKLARLHRRIAEIEGPRGSDAVDLDALGGSS